MLASIGERRSLQNMHRPEATNCASVLTGRRRTADSREHCYADLYRIPVAKGRDLRSSFHAVMVLRALDNVSLRHYVNAARIFSKSAEAKFPSFAAQVVADGYPFFGGLPRGRDGALSVGGVMEAFDRSCSGMSSAADEDDGSIPSICTTTAR